ncbi:MAG: CHAT domain-containing protein [Acidobacteria bacterium]|nr:CHAT domain-containing protein [Acidobacteriota bacterium]
MHERIQTFEELALRLRPDGAGAYVVQVVHSPYGCRDVRFDLKDLGFPFDSLRRIDFSASESRELGEVEPPQGGGSATPETLGGTLFRALFRDDLLSTFLMSLGRIQGRKDLGLRIRLIFDPLDPASRQLLSLPWELLYRPDTRDFLARSRFTPVVRYLEVPRLTTPLELTSQLRILVVLANPAGTAGLDLERECQQMESVLRENPRIRLEVLRSPSLPEIRSALQRFEAHVFHYMGHGGFDSKSGEGSLLFEDSQRRPQPVGAGVLAEALKNLPSLRLVFLNACRTAQVSEDPKLDPFSGSASALSLAGVPAILAMQLPISDRAALMFSQRLYEMLAQAFPVDAAVAEARLAVHLDAPSSYEWATPALYMSVPDGCLFAPAPPGDEEDHFALGLSYLDQGLYDLSAAAFQRVLGKTTHEEDLLYYLALALIGGQRPRALKLATIRQIETYLAAAIRLNDRKSHYKLLLAAAKYDYYASNGLRIPSPPVDQLLKEAANGEIDPKEVRLMLRHAPLPPGDLLSVVQNFCH